MSVATWPWFLALAGLAAGFVLGFAARANHFCTMSALERYWYAADSRGLRTWILAGTVALVATQALQAGGIYERRGYLPPGEHRPLREGCEELVELMVHVGGQRYVGYPLA